MGITENDISNEELLKDIHNTELEFSAYDKLQSGFLILSELPENKDSNKILLFRHKKYCNLRDECFNFLEKLIILKSKRGL